VLLADGKGARPAVTEVRIEGGSLRRLRCWTSAGRLSTFWGMDCLVSGLQMRRTC